MLKGRNLSQWEIAFLFSYSYFCGKKSENNQPFTSVMQRCLKSPEK